MPQFLAQALLRLMLLSLLLAIWNFVVDPFIEPVVLIVQWFLSLGLWQYFPTPMFQAIWDSILVILTLLLFIFVFHTNEPQPGAPKASFFSNRKL